MTSTMMAPRFRIFTVCTFLLFLAVLPLVNAFPVVSRFYVKMYANPSDATINHHYVLDNYEILDFYQFGNLTAEGGNIGTPPIGRLDWRVVWVIDLATLRSAMFGQFTMRFDSGQYAGKTLGGTFIVPEVTVFPGGGGK